VGATYSNPVPSQPQQQCCLLKSPPEMPVGQLATHTGHNQRAQMSVRLSTAFPRACSGLM